MKKLLAMLMTLVLTAAMLTGCGPTGDKTPSPTPAGTAGSPSASSSPSGSGGADAQTHTAPVTLTFWAYSKWSGITGEEADGQAGDWEKAAAEQFMALHDNVTIEVEVMDNASGPEKAAIAIATGEQANVLHDSESRMFEYANDGLLLPISDYLTDAEKGAYVSGALASTALSDGKSYYLPFGTSPIVMMVNYSLFEQAGCTDLLPQNDERTWTLDQYHEAVSTACGKLSGVYAAPLFANTSSGDAFTFLWLWATGGGLLDGVTGEMTVNTPETKTGLAFWQGMVQEGLASPGGANMKAGDVWTQFYQQAVLTVPAGAVNYARAVSGQATGDVEEFDIRLYMMPVAEGMDQVSAGFPHGFAAFKSDDAEEEYWSAEFVKFLASEENAGAVKAASEVSFKTSQSHLYDDANDPNMDVVINAASYQVPNGTAIPGYTTFRSQVSDYMALLYDGDLTVDEFAAQVEELGNNFFATYE